MLAGRRNFILAAIFVVLWLLPVAQQGFTCQLIDGMPKFLNDMARVSCLFTDRVPSWDNYYFQVRLEGQETWLDVPKSDYTRMPPFGHRTRLDFILSESGSRRNGNIIRTEMASFIKKRYELLHPGGPRVSGVRYVYARYAVGEPVIARPKGHWVVPPIEEVEEWRKRFLATIVFEGDQPMLVGLPHE